MKIATWNVNSVRARLPRLLEWLEIRTPDVVCLQETKCVDEEFPHAELQRAGYHIAHWGQRSYNGVAILSKLAPSEVTPGFGGCGDEARFICARIGDLRIASVYVINGEAVGTEKYQLKLESLKKLRDHIQKMFSPSERYILAGDWNLTFDDRDVYDPILWREKIFCSTKERAALRAITDCGLRDLLRKFHHRNGIYTWFDFRTGGFQRGQGLRIDHFLVSTPVFVAGTEVFVDLEERAKEKPSDHAPVIATFRE